MEPNIDLRIEPKIDISIDPNLDLSIDPNIAPRIDYLSNIGFPQPKQPDRPMGQFSLASSIFTQPLPPARP